jgi:hypothetical protein
MVGVVCTWFIWRNFVNESGGEEQGTQGALLGLI